ncbi:uncharacterized protein WCC33_014879 [Rhinophrynus dorsalis]
MRSPPPDTGPEIDKLPENETDMQPSNEKMKGVSEKDSGFSDSSSESLSSEDNGGTAAVGVSESSEEKASAQPAYTSIYVLQNVVVKQPQLLLLKHPICHRRKRTPSSYLPILRSYPRIAPRLDPPPTPTATTTSSPPCSPPPIDRKPTPPLLEISLRSLALLRRTRETQRSIRELRAHAKMYDRALRGEEGGWERLQRAMERSGWYRGGQTSSGGDSASSSNEDEPMSSSEKPVLPMEINGKTRLSSEDIVTTGGSDGTRLTNVAS